MPDYIPRTDEGRILWLTQFTAWLNANGASHGFNSIDINAMTTATTAATTAFTGYETARAAAKAARTTKDDKIGEAIALAREDAQRIQTYPTTTDADRANAGLTIPDTTSTPSSDDKILTTPAPLLLLDFSVRRQVTIHWGPNPHNEHQNARPAGTIGCQIEYAIGGIPASENDWHVLETDTESPCIHSVHEEAATTIAYRARYVGKNLKLGAYGDPVVCTVTM